MVIGKENDCGSLSECSAKTAILMVDSWQVREKDQKYPLDKQMEKSSLPDRMSLWGEEEGA